MQVLRLNSDSPDFEQQLAKRLAWDESTDAQVLETVQGIISAIRKNGDAALLKYTNRFDRRSESSVQALQVERRSLEEALGRIPAELKQALQTAAERIRQYHQHQQQDSWQYTEADGTVLGQKITPMDKVGLYVPGGKASYPSSVLMNAIPAKVAGVAELVMVVPAPDGELNDVVLAAAAIAGVDTVFTIGGAQAVAALAYGTATIPRVDKIVGPGNIYVATAKKLVFGQVGLDMIAGPSEILVICDGKTDPQWIALDLFSQAEHDENAQSILLCPDVAYLDAVEAAMNGLLEDMPRKDIIQRSMEQRGFFVRVKDLEEAAVISNRIAPEHLELSVDDPETFAEKISHAGAIFMGRYTPEALGDYCAGPNHVLPTSGTARFSSPLGVYDFVKRSSIINCSAAGSDSLGRVAVVLADAENLPAHGASARVRLDPASREKP